MSTASTLSTYLSEQKTRFLGDKGNGWTIVMGNEAGDLDSLASSIGLAWLLSRIPAINTNTIPLITTTREDFRLRAENLYALQLAGIREGFHELLCPEDLPKPNLCTSFALVDHNSLQPTYTSPSARVSVVVDHHEDEGHYLDTASPRIVEVAGSCASLVTRVIKSYPAFEIPPELAMLLLSAIVIDTHGLKKGGKAVDVDYGSSAWLLARVNVVASESHIGKIGINSHNIYDSPWIQSLSGTLSAKKSAISHLSTRDLLRRDYKEYDLNPSPAVLESGNSPRSIKAGLATVPLSLSTYFSPFPSPTSAVIATQEWIRERGLSILGVLTTYKSKKGKSKREVLWVIDENAMGSRFIEVFFKGFEASKVLHAKRRDFEQYGVGGQTGKDDESDDEESSGEAGETGNASPFGEGLIARVYKQKKPLATRKQVAPILKQLVEG